MAQQSCPAQGSARAALMPPLPVGKHANVVFLAQQSDSSLLQRYDVTTGATQTILQINQEESVLGASVSPDGQWVLFGALLQDQSAIQLVRMDGQQLQTLYCAPAQTNVNNLVLSPDRHYLVFNQVNSDESASILYLLDMRTGKLQTELATLQPNYPVFGQGLAQTSSMPLLTSSFSQHKASDSLPARPFNPLPSKHYPIYIPMKWATNSSIYLLGRLIATPSPPPQLVLLRDISKDVTQQGSNLQPIVVTPETNNCQDVDVTPDSQQVVCSSYIQFGTGNPSSILMQPTTGGAFRSVYRNAAGGSLTARAFSDSTIIFILYRQNAPPALFKINSDGGGLTQLMAAPTTKTLLNITVSGSSYLPWSIASRDGTLYALQLYDLTTDKQSLIFGSVSGGMPKTITSSSNQLAVVGWTEI